MNKLIAKGLLGLGLFVLLVYNGGCGRLGEVCGGIQTALDANTAAMEISSPWCLAHPEEPYCKGLVKAQEALLKTTAVCGEAEE